jgi:hypothetical protein
LLPASVFFKQAGSACISIGPINVRVEDYQLHISTRSEYVDFQATIPVPTVSCCPGPQNFTFKYLKYVIPWMRKGTKELVSFMDETRWRVHIPTKKHDIMVSFRSHGYKK